MKRTICIILIYLLLFGLCACSDRPEDGSLTLVDDRGKEIKLSGLSRIAAGHASFAECWLLSGGSLVGVTSDALSDHGLEAPGAKIIGSAKTLSLEALVASGAEAVLLSLDLTSHIQLEESLASVGIAAAYFRVDTFADYASLMSRFCALTGRDDLYRKNVTRVGERIDAVCALGGCEGTRVLLIRAYSSGIKAKGDDNPAGLILKELGALNVADEYPSLLEDMTLEHIVLCDPDCILVLTMGNEEAALSYLKSCYEDNPAFASLRAVKGGRYHILPKELFHYKPNERWDESYEYLRDLLNP